MRHLQREIWNGCSGEIHLVKHPHVSHVPFFAVLRAFMKRNSFCSFWNHLSGKYLEFGMELQLCNVPRKANMKNTKCSFVMASGLKLLTMIYNGGGGGGGNEH